MKNRILILSVLVATLVACSGDSMVNDDINLTKSDNNLTSKKAVERPFKIKKATGTWSTFLGDGECSPVVLNALGEGTVTHLGLSTMFEEWCFTGEQYNIGTRTLTLTAANGDLLYGTIDDIIWTSWPFTFEEPVELNGGTGRFAEAYGTFWQSVEVTYETDVNGTYTMSGEGTLTY